MEKAPEKGEAMIIGAIIFMVLLILILWCCASANYLRGRLDERRNKPTPWWVGKDDDQ